jgi:predicted metal-dependent RNase
MAKFILKTKITNILRGNNSKTALELKWLGTGGAFDHEERNSSVVFKVKNGKRFLVDCGSTVYEDLKKKKLIEEIDYVFITHTHDDHLSSLSTLIYDRFFIHHKPIKIICLASIQPILMVYLMDVCNHSEGQFTINEVTEEELETDFGMKLFVVDTEGNHTPTMKTSGFVFNFKINDQELYIVYSGDINTPIINLMNDELKTKLLINPDNVFIFHDMTIFDYPGNVHTNYKLLEPLTETFKNIFVYHHNKAQSDVLKQENSMLQSVVTMDKDLIIVENLGL